jgi:integrase
MRGSTRKRGRTWTAYWWPVDVATGKPKQRSRGGFARQKDAERFLSETLVAVNAGSYSEPSKQLFARFLLDEWIPAVSATLEPLTRERYAGIVRNVAARQIGAIPLRNLNASHFNALHAELEREGLAVTTRRLMHAVLSRAMTDAVRWEKLTRNPVSFADPPKAPRSRVTAWTPNELRRFLEHVRDDRLYAAWRLDALTGMRRGELLGVTWEALDLDGGRLRIDRQVIPHPGDCEHCGCRHRMSLAAPKRKRSERTIALDPETIAALRRHRDVQLLERALAEGAYRDHDLVFCDELGDPIHPQRMTTRFARHRKAAGIPVGTIHVLRHTHATIALTEGVPLHVVAARLGDDPRVLLGVYSHLLPHSDEQAALVVAEAVH